MSEKQMWMEQVKRLLFQRASRAYVNYRSTTVARSAGLAQVNVDQLLLMNNCHFETHSIYNTIDGNIPFDVMAY